MLGILAFGAIGATEGVNCELIDISFGSVLDYLKKNKIKIIPKGLVYVLLISFGGK